MGTYTPFSYTVNRTGDTSQLVTLQYRQATSHRPHPH